MKRKRGIPTRADVQAQRPVELRFNAPLDPNDPGLPKPADRLNLERKAAPAETAETMLRYQETIAAGGLIDEHSAPGQPARATLVKVSTPPPQK